MSSTQQRPTSVTVIGWYLAISGSFGVILCCGIFKILDTLPPFRQALETNALPIPMQIAQMYVGAFGTLVAAIGILKGKNWGRLTYAGLSVFQLLLGLVTMSQKWAAILGACFSGLFCYLLFRSKVDFFFKN